MNKFFSTFAFLILFWGAHWVPPLSSIRQLSYHYLGLHANWIWAIDCAIAAFYLSRYWTLKLEFWPKRQDKQANLIIFALIAGLALQGLFALLGFRTFRFQGIHIELLLFQIFSAFTEEMLYRGILQHRLARAWRSRMSNPLHASLSAALTIALPYGFVHGLSPLLARGAHFDFTWSFGTCVFSLVAGVFYAFEPTLLAPIVLHLCYGVIARLF